MEIKEVVRAYIAEHNLLDRKEKYIVALSGGSDSVALLLLLLDLGYQVEAAHCNFHLRGAESDRDEDFVKALCVSRNVPFHTVHFDTRGYAALHKISIEMAARRLRYGYFENLRNDIGALAICVAHHRDDNVETVLMNLVRGTGVSGLAGIRPVNGKIVRPLLCVSRNDIERYLSSIGQAYVTDSSNLVDDVVRNKIRLNVMPLLREINPSVSVNIQRATEHVADAIRILDDAIEAAIRRVSELADGSVFINLDRLRAEKSPAYLLYEILKDYGFTSAQVSQIYAGVDAPSGRVFSAADYDLLIDRGRIIVEPRRDDIKPLKIVEDGVYLLPEEKRLKVNIVQIDDDFVLSRSAETVCLDADKVRFPLILRSVEAGDRFIPFGMKGSKLISDYLTDRKKTLFQKRRQLLLSDADGRVVWLVCERPDNRFRISAATKRALVVSFG